MFDFCSECGETIGQEQVVGQMLVCRKCGHKIGVVIAPVPNVMVDATEELIRQGKAARCPLCQQVIEVKPSGNFVPHYEQAAKRICKNSGKAASTGETKPTTPSAAETKPAASPIHASPIHASPIHASPIQRPATSKDLSAYYTRESIKVVACRQGAEPTIEELTLEYLDKSDRVRMHIEALRDILGTDFRMKAYPDAKRAELGIWGNATLCVIAKKHPQGGILPLSDGEIREVVDVLKANREVFFR